MKKTLRLVAVFALMGATLAYTGCTDYSKDFDDINNRIEALESGKLKSVEEQVAGLKSTVASLEDAKAKAEAAIAELQKNSATAADLKALEAKLDAAVKDAASKAAVEDLKSKIEKLEADLAKYAKVETLNAEVEKLNKAIADAKALTEKEFATVNDKIKAITDWQVEAVAKLGALEGQIKTLEEGLATSQQDIITLTEGLKSVSAATGILEDEVEKIYDELNIAWDRIRELTEGLRSTTAGLAIAEQDIIALQTDMTDVKEALKALKEASAKHVTADDVKEAVKTAVAEAIANDGVISAEIAKAVKAATDKLQAQIDAVKNVVKNLTEQIQSIVYVPETKDGQMSAAIYKLGKDFETPVMIKASYEITPHELVSSISASNLCASSVAVKAAPAEIFPVRIMNADPATGRLDVRIDVPAESDAYEVLTAEGDLDKTPSVALALNISESKISTIPGDDDTMIDTGCKKSSSYVTVNRKGALSSIDLAKTVVITKDGKVVLTKDGKIATSASVNYPVYYDAADSKTVLFEGYDTALEIDGTLMTLSEASEFFGTNLTLKPTNTDVITYYKDKNKIAANKAPIVVENLGLATTAEIRPLENVRGSKMVGYKAVVKFGTFKLNGEDVSIEFNATYTISNTVAEIVYEDEHIAWSYKYDNKISRHDSKANLEIEGLGTLDTSFGTNGNGFEIERYVDGESTGLKGTGDAIEKATAQVSDEDDDFTVTGKIKFENLYFTEGKQTVYIVKYQIKGKRDNKDYSAVCKVILDPMPESKEIQLPTVEVERNFTAPSVKDITPIKATYAADNSWYKNQTDLNSEAKFRAKYIADKEEGQITLTDLDGKPLKDLDGNPISNSGFVFVASEATENNKKFEKSTIEIPASASAYDEFVIKQPVTVFGVTYTYVIPVKFTDSAFSLKTNPTRVNENFVTQLDGTYKFGNPVEKFALNAIDLSTFFYVAGHANSSETLEVDYYRITTKKVNNTYVEVEKAINVGADNKLSSLEVEGNSSKISAQSYNWPDEPLSEVKVRAKLYMKNNRGTAALDSLDVTMKVRDMIPTFTPITHTETVVEGEDATVNIFNYVSAVDYKGQNLVYAGSKTLLGMWSLYKEGYYDDDDNYHAPVTVTDYYKVFDQSLSFEEEKDIEVLHNNTPIDPSLVKFTYTPSDGTLTLSKNNGTLLGTVTFKIDVTLNYMFGYKKTQKVVINFNCGE